MPSTTIEDALSAWLASQTTWYNSFGGRLYYMDVKDRATLPYVAYFIVVDTCEPEAFEYVNAGKALVQFTVVTQLKSEKSIVYALKALLLNFQGQMDGFNVQSVVVEGIRDVGPLTNNCFEFHLDATITFAY